MELENALDIFSEICEICYEINHPILNEALPSLEIDVSRAKTVEEIHPHVTEILVLLEEAVSDYPEEQEAYDQILELQEQLYDT